MKALLPELQFDPQKPFYAMVLGYLTQVHGFLEICSRGVLARLQKDSPENVEAWLQKEQSKVVRDFYAAALAGRKETPLFGRQELASRTGAGIRVETAQLAEEVISNHLAGVEYFNRISAGGLLIIAWEMTSEYHSCHELWEFLRHCRNAAAHRGHFHLVGNEPRRPARWRSLEITHALQGKPLFPVPPEQGFLGIGDVLYLLSDLESTFQMEATAA
jgi:hypothetical protein